MSTTILKPRSFEDLQIAILLSVGSVDSLLFVEAIRNTGMNIYNIEYDVLQNRIVINDSNPDVLSRLQVNLALAKAKSSSGRNFNVAFAANGAVFISLVSFDKGRINSSGQIPVSVTSGQISYTKNNHVQKNILHKLNKDEEKHLINLHVALIESIRELLLSDKQVVLLIGEEHESLKSMQANLMLLSTLKEAGFTINNVVLELTKDLLEKNEQTSLFYMLVAKSAQNLFNAKLLPGLKKVYANSDTKYIDKDLAECTINNLGVIPDVTLIFVGLNHLVPIASSIIDIKKAMPVMLNHSFASAENYSGLQRQFIELTEKICFSPGMFTKKPTLKPKL